jgi:hypothetical protein
MKRTDLLIAGFLAVLFLFAAGGMMVFWLQSNAYANLTPESPALVRKRSSDVIAGVTAKSAIELTETNAKQWQADAVIISVSATILKFDSLEDIYNGQANWTIVYYSPAALAVATFTGNGTNSNFLNAKKIDIVPQGIDFNSVQLDSGNAMVVAMSNGGRDLLGGEQAQRVAHLMLTQQQDSDQAEWQIVIQNETSGTHLTFRINAASGEVLEKSGL